MTYKQLTKQIEYIDAQIQFMKDVRDSHYSDDKPSNIMIGNIVNTLICWKNYLLFDRDYTDTSVMKMEVEDLKRKLNSNE